MTSLKLSVGSRPSLQLSNVPAARGYGDFLEMGTDEASRILHDIGRALGRPLAHLCTFLDPERVIADTTIGPAIEPIVAGIREAFTTHAPPVIARDVTISLSRLGGAAELRGALELPREAARRPSV
ncbi:putative NBD/HSP70 family sugar kinase [Actinoplanes lutulentus]|uniref:Uncharacterized protein n=1 Tax=Actinoplanes lutulentus TaxID=1287878 RepID=A0A327ZBN4_9ACTN|nr:ROK family protein [Actinoplanes lutulentus]MBB2947376.1 putative NBD/HSP70 family sugar kinase [Actinoplanes lutulentus]RAK36650.1 hypothetical protein B0I29_108240 [Actinoplanes lutulentus]